MISEPARRPRRVSGSEMLARRMEFKYVVDRTTRTALAQDLGRLMRPDSYAGPNGCYRVRSLYFDTPNFQAYHDKLAGLAARQKLRVRTYGDEPSQTECVRLEVKSRYLHFIQKIAIDVPREEYGVLEQSFRNRTLPRVGWLNDPGISKEFFRLQKQHSMEPKILLEYRRQAFDRKELGRIRVNFDDELLATTHLDLLSPLVGARRLLRYGHSVFEIKVDDFLPSWLHSLIVKYNLQNQAFSKYCHALRSSARMTSTSRAF